MIASFKSQQVRSEIIVSNEIATQILEAYHLRCSCDYDLFRCRSTCPECGMSISLRVGSIDKKYDPTGIFIGNCAFIGAMTIAIGLVIEYIIFGYLPFRSWILWGMICNASVSAVFIWLMANYSGSFGPMWKNTCRVIAGAIVIVNIVMIALFFSPVIK